MDGIEVLNQELTERINTLQTELDNNKRQKVAVSIIKSLKSAENLNPGYNLVMNAENDNLEVSPEGIATFVDLLDSSEYIKGHNTGGNDFLGEHPREHTYDVYYLTMGPGILLEFTFRQTEIKGYAEEIKSYDLTIRSYNDSEDLSVKADSKHGWPTVDFLRQNGTSVFESPTFEETLALNGKKLNDALVPVSPEDLANRFLNVINVQKENNMRQ